jgi:hypothetical protein
MSKGVFTILDSFNGSKQSNETLLSYTLYERLEKLSVDNARILAETNKKLSKVGLPISHIDTRPDIFDIEKTHTFHMATIYKPFTALAYQYIGVGTTGSNSAITNASDKNILQFRFDVNSGTFLHDMVLHLVLDTVGSDGSSVKYKYCALPGARLCKKTRISVDRQLLDEYTSDEIIFHYNFEITSDKRDAWTECMGEQQEETGSFYNSSFGGITESFKYKDGAQTPKTVQPKLELWIPLLFWFNLRYEQSYINVAAKSDQRFIEIELNKLSNILQATDVDGVPIALPITQLGITTATLYTRNIYVDPLIQDIFVQRHSTAVVRIHKEQRKELNLSHGKILFNEFKYLVEQIQFGFRAKSNELSMSNWYKFGKIISREYPVPAFIAHVPLELVVRTAVIETVVPVIDDITVNIHGNILYIKQKNSFFNKYLPYVARDIVSSVSDAGIYLIPFNLNNGIKTFSGYVNLSRAREVYLEYSEGIDMPISTSNPVEFVAYAKTLAIIEYQNPALFLKFAT